MPAPSESDDGVFETPTKCKNNSKKHLRHDFARARLKSVFRTCESPTPSESSLERRRSSLKGMRQFLSLPSSNVSMLSMLLMSKVRLPRYASIDVEMKRQMRMCNERDFFLEIVKDISHDLDLRSLTGRILVNICLLLNADRSSLFFVEGSKGHRSLVSKVFDAYTGTECIPTCTGDNRVRIPWGQGIIGHVAATGDNVNITNASEVSFLYVIYHVWTSMLEAVIECMNLLPDNWNCELHMCRECRERLTRHRGLAITTCIMARAWRTCLDACRDR